MGPMKKHEPITGTAYNRDSDTPLKLDITAFQLNCNKCNYPPLELNLEYASTRKIDMYEDLASIKDRRADVPFY